MKVWKKKYLFDMLIVIAACSIVLFDMFMLSTKASGKENDAKENYEVEETKEPDVENYVIISVDVPEESEEPDISEEPTETEPVEIEEIKYPFNERYKDIEVTAYDIDLMAAVVHHESNNQCFAGQRMVAEVILNRVVQGDMGGTTIRDVIYAKNQFFYVTDADIARANETNYQAVYAALNETPITDADVVYFAMSPYNNHVFCKIEDHYFCRKY